MQARYEDGDSPKMSGRVPGAPERTRPTPPSRRRRFYAPVVLTASTVLSLLLLELVVRSVGLAPALPAAYDSFVSDPHLPFRIRANLVSRGTNQSGEFEFEYRYNSEGFRDVEHSLRKPEGTFRILGLGDSFTFGVGAPYKQTYLARLETLLNQRQASGTVEVIKAGMPKYHPELERILLQHYGTRYEPDLVLVAFLPNDIWGTFVGPENARPTSQSGYLISSAGRKLGSTGVWLYMHSHAARILIRAYLDRSSRPDGAPTSANEMTATDKEESAARVAEEFMRMRDIANENDARFVLVSTPNRISDPSGANTGCGGLSGTRSSMSILSPRLELPERRPAGGSTGRRTDTAILRVTR